MHKGVNISIFTNSKQLATKKNKFPTPRDWLNKMHFNRGCDIGLKVMIHFIYLEMCKNIYDSMVDFFFRLFI